MNPSRRVLITGASSGLGEALAREHAAQGHALLLFARRAARLKSLARACRSLGAPEALVCAGDVRKAGDLSRAVRLARKNLGGLDVAYANAGYSQSGGLETLGLADWRRQMEVNVEGVLLTVQACLPLLKEARGCLGLIGSVSGYGSTAETGAYAASKAAVRALAQVLDLELAGSGVGVTHVAPGFFASEIRLKNPDGSPAPGKPEYIPSWLLGDPAVLAAQVRRAVQARRREIVLPRHAKLAVFLLRHVPGPAQGLLRRISAARTRRRRAVQGR